MYERVLTIDPTNTRARNGLGWCYLDRKDFAQAKGVFKKAIARAPSSIETLIGLWHCSQHEGVYEEMEKISRRVLELDPRSDWAYFALGLYYRDHVQFKQAEKMFKRSIDLDPEQYQAYLALGDLYRIRGKFKKALKMYGCIGEIQLKQNSGFLMRLAECYNALGYYDAAIEHYMKVQQVAPEQYEAYIGLGECYRRKKDLKNAENAFNTAITINAQKSSAYLGLNACFMEQKQYQQAKEVLLIAFEHQVSDLESDRERWDKLPASISNYEVPIKKQLAIEPQDNEMLNVLGWFYRYQGRYQKAIITFDRLISLQQGNPSAYEGLGWCWLALDKIEKAQDSFERALTIEPTTAGALLGLALVYLNCHDHQTSEEFLRKSRNIDRDNWRGQRLLLYYENAL